MNKRLFSSLDFWVLYFHNIINKHKTFLILKQKNKNKNYEVIKYYKTNLSKMNPITMCHIIINLKLRPKS